ncbi:TetR/AcrR family transcriptional regulator [Paenibacillus turpanensis]|uniref:TetR/AcrR family transcriptional regulator n=1 Tax=Paenibacillus turpanensis TaxID=2689078 RepID=UPI00140B5A2D|nr:TetR/AcrR family transcriptional regulator [Paenibacillus turpanensis]
MTSRKIEKYDAILNGALKAFAEYGYHGCQVSKIARAAGVADGTIYLYFKSKEEILVKLFEEQLGRLVAKFDESLSETKDARDALRNICSIHYSELESNVDLAYVTQIELRQSSLELRREIGQSLKPYIKLIEQVVCSGMEQGIFRPDLDVKLTRLLIFGAMDEVVTSWLISGRKYSLTAQVDGTVDFLTRGLSIHSPN